MLDALDNYSSVLLSTCVFLVPITLATIGIGLALREYSAILTPQVGGRPLTGSRRWNVLKASGEMLFLLAFSAACYGIVSLKLARASAAMFLPEQRTIALTVGLAAGFMYAFVKVLKSDRANYLVYRRSTNFRIWLSGVPGNGLSAAHEYYLAGWRFRAVGEAFSTALMFGVFSALISLVTKLPASGSYGKRGWILSGTTLAALVTFSLLRATLVRLWLVLRPEYGLADLCTNPVALREQDYERKTQRFTVHRPGAWRGQDHEDSFKIANLLEWSVRRAQGRYAQHHYDELVLAARRLAQLLRLKALEVEPQNPDAVAAYEERKFLALQLACSRSPLDFADRITELASGEPEPPELPQRRAARVIESISGAINAHWPALKTIAIAAAIAWLLWSGKLMDAVGLLK